MLQDVGHKVCEDIDKLQAEGGRKQDWTQASRPSTHKPGDLNRITLSGTQKLRPVEIGCLHDKIKSGVWRGDPSECDLTNVGLKPHAGQVLHFGIHLVLKGFFTRKSRFS